MERVDGIGGFFFRAADPDGLAAWYEQHLGIDPVPTSYGATVWTQREGPTVFAPFGPDPAESPIIGRGGWGINFRVRDLDAIVAQLRSSGVDVEVDETDYPNGRFAQLNDPEGNAIQLWEPKEPVG
ncbi:MAG TPA: VOC family protein [Actinomycetota bacterium]|nr:VOC family protein [Actinomycetota bacterium]